jgi:hypothetical protein
MQVEMDCVCSARLSVDCEEEYSDAAWVLGVRFASAHEKCGFVAPPFGFKDIHRKKMKNRHYGYF